MMKKPTITIGIPAYNEEANIGALLSAVLSQSFSKTVLDEIIVVSDASTDRTDEIVKLCNDPRITLVCHNERKGNSEAQNTIIGRASGDVLVMLDADILPKHTYFIENIAMPVVNDPTIGMTSAKIVPAMPRGFIESVLARNHLFKTEFFEKNKKGVYLTFGPARAFSKALYKNFMYPSDCPTDAYSYFFTVTRGFRFYYCGDVSVLFRCPSNFKDYQKQNQRFEAGKQSFYKYFDAHFVRDSYSLPLPSLVVHLAQECLFHPVCAAVFGSMLIMSRLCVRRAEIRGFSAMWDIARSSKKI